MTKIANSTEKINKILVKEANWLGDVVMTLPTLAAIKEMYPKSDINVLVKGALVTLFGFVDSVGTTVGYGFTSKKAIMEKMVLTGKLREESYDLAVLMPNSFESALWTYMAKIPKRLGYARDARSLLLTSKVAATKERKNLHQAEYYFELVKELGYDKPISMPKLVVNKKQREEIRNWLESKGISKNKKYMVISPFAAYGPAKEWGVERFSELCKKIKNKHDYEIIIAGNSDEAERIELKQEALSNLGFNLCGQTNLEQLICILSESSLFVGNDSGAMHVAAALGVPTVGIFGSTSPEKTKPLGLYADYVASSAECRPCLKRVCPKDDFCCMNNISVDMVFEKVLSVLEKAENKNG